MKIRTHLLLSLTLVAGAQAQDFNYANTSGTITITGYTGPGGNVTIPGEINGLPVTSIAGGAFRFSGISGAIVPDSVTNIGFQAFAYCQNLTSIEVGALNGMYTTTEGVLFDKLQSTLIQCPSGKAGVYSVPNGVTTIAEWAFASCDNLKSITIPDGVTGIPPHGMYLCHGLTNVNIPNSVNSIGDQAFVDCSSLTSINIPNSVASIGGDVFDGCGLTCVTIPDTVTSIGQMAFQSCANLARVKLPNGITGIASQMFSRCASLTNITIPESVANIESAAFAGCTNLAGVYFEGNAPAVGGDLFNTPISPVVWDPVTVYYLPGSLGWSGTFAGRPTALWLLNADTSPTTFGFRNNPFGFTINWGSGRVIAVEVCTNLATGVWSPVSTNTLINGLAYFSDPQWTNYPERFYRIRSP